MLAWKAAASPNALIAAAGKRCVASDGLEMRMSEMLENVLKSRGFRSFLSKVEDKCPPLRAWHRFQYQEYFEQQTSEKVWRFSGAYGTREEALAAIPKDFLVGHDREERADRHETTIGRIWPSDYPILFWLSSLLEPGTTLFDLGGSLGSQFYSFQKYFAYPPDFRWTICDVPAVAELGTKQARENGAHTLTYTTKIEEASGFSLLLSCGTIQFLETPLWESLRQLGRKPKHLLLNRIPISDGPTFLTVSSLGAVSCPYKIWNRAEFMEGIARAGYSLVDSWENPEFCCYIPFHANRAVKAYTGMYLRLADA